MPSTGPRVSYQVGADLTLLDKDLKGAEAKFKATGSAAEKALGGQATAGATKLGKAQGFLVKQQAALKKGFMSGMGIAGGVVAFAALAKGVQFVTGTIGDAIKRASEFQAAMTESLAIMGDVSEETRAKMEKAARDVALTTTFSANAAAKSYFYLASAGLDAAQSIGAMPQVAKFAQAGAFDLAKATDLLTDAQSALGKTSKDAAVNMREMSTLSDILVRANTLANATVEQFSASLTEKAGAAMRKFNIDTADGVAVLATFADAGLKGEKAGNTYSAMLEGLALAAVKNADQFKELGIEVYDASGRMRDHVSVIDDLTAALGPMSDEQRTAAFRQLGLNKLIGTGVTLLLGMTDKVKGYRDELADAAGFTDEVAGKQLESFDAKVTLLQHSLDDLSLSAGQMLIGPLTDLVDYLRLDVIPTLEKLGKVASLDIMGLHGQENTEAARLRFMELGEAAGFAESELAALWTATEDVTYRIYSMRGPEILTERIHDLVASLHQLDQQAHNAGTWALGASFDNGSAALQRFNKRIVLTEDELEALPGLITDVADSLGNKGLAKAAREARDEFDKMSKGPDRLKKQMRLLSDEMDYWSKVQEKAHRQGRTDLETYAGAQLMWLSEEYTAREAVLTAIKAARQEERQAQKEREKAAAERQAQLDAEAAEQKRVHDLNRMGLKAVQDELGVSKEKAKELWQQAKKDYGIKMPADEQQVLEAFAAARKLWQQTQLDYTIKLAVANVGAVRQAIVNAMPSGWTAGWGNKPPGGQHGGPIYPGAYEVNERGREMLITGGRGYLLDAANTTAATSGQKNRVDHYHHIDAQSARNMADAGIADAERVALLLRSSVNGAGTRYRWAG